LLVDLFGAPTPLTVAFKFEYLNSSLSARHSSLVSKEEIPRAVGAASRGFGSLVQLFSRFMRHSLRPHMSCSSSSRSQRFSIGILVDTIFNSLSGVFMLVLGDSTISYF